MDVIQPRLVPKLATNYSLVVFLSALPDTSLKSAFIDHATRCHVQLYVIKSAKMYGAQEKLEAYEPAGDSIQQKKSCKLVNPQFFCQKLTQPEILSVIFCIFCSRYALCCGINMFLRWLAIP
uniref:Uncharacterized protein n=1 Tax=Glossina austeni TaxID=7395 RepID=A0A1A9UUY3_GLOAU